MSESFQHRPRRSRPSTFISLLRAVFGFNSVPLTVLVVAVYVGVIFTVGRIEGSLEPPFALDLIADDEVANFEATWADLQQISQSYHPYNSYANDKVHDYLATTVKSITAKSKGVTIDTEPQNVIYESRGVVKYYEGNNVLVRLEGTNSTLPALLISAHFDSVPTGKGATDDGVGIATMLGLLRAFNTKRLPRDVVFNFNNNEEFGLMGAQAFTFHPWAKDIEVFINLEGAGAGGKAILLQTTDHEVAKHYSSARSPSAGSIIEQGFQSDIVGSLTDFNVYRDFGMRGIDIAFFKPRSWYHTYRDSIKGTSRSSVAHMFINALDVARSLGAAQGFESTSPSGDIDPSVYFDLFGKYFIALPLSLWILINLGLLIGGPLLAYAFYVPVVKSHRWTDAASPRAILGTIIPIIASIAISQLYVKFNPFIIVSDIVSPLLVMLSVFVLTGAFILGLGDRLSPVVDQKLSVLLILHGVWWVLLAGSTYNLYTLKSGGMYLATGCYARVLQSVLIGLIGWSLFGGPRHKASHRGTSRVIVDNEGTDPDADENTPLIDENAPESQDETHRYIEERNNDDDNDTDEEDEDEDTEDKISSSCAESYDWIFQFLFTAGTVYTIYYQYYVVLDSVHMSILDNLSYLAWIYAGVGVYAALLGSVLLPFVHKLHITVLLVVTATCIWLAVQTSFGFPFSETSPYKVRFVQELNVTSPGEAYVNVQGVAVKEYLQPILEDLPSVKQSGSNVECFQRNVTGEVWTCQYPWNSSKEPFGSWLHVNVTKPSAERKPENSAAPVGPNRATLKINSTQSRLCSLAFDTSEYGQSPLRKISVGASSLDVSELRQVGAVELRKLAWDGQLEVQVEWVSRWTEEKGFITQLPVTVTCKWSDLSPEAQYSVASYQELLDYSPSWVTWANLDAGVVLVHSRQLVL